MHPIDSTRRGLIALPLSLALAGAHAAEGHDYPTKPVRFIIPFSPGGSTDILARLVGQDYFAGRKPVIPENAAGAAGNIGAAIVARAPADGYTLEIGAMSIHAMNGSMYRKLPFDPMGDFEAIAMLAYAINVIAVSADLPVHTFPDLLAYLRANPGRVNYASGGIGTHNHLTLALLAKTAKLDIVHVPYKGGGPAVAALVQGECGLYAGGATLVLPHVKSGRVRILAVTEGQRSALLPGIPSASETVKGYEVANWYAMFGPKGMAPSLSSRINGEVNRITAQPAVVTRLGQMGMVSDQLTPAQLTARLQAEYRQWSTIIRDLGIEAG